VDKNTYTIQFTISSVTLLIAAGLAILLLGQGYFFAKDLAMTAMDKVFVQVSEKTSERVDSLNRRAQDLVSVFHTLEQLNEPPQPGNRHQVTKLFVEALKTNSDLYGIYVGYKNGDLFMVANIVDRPKLQQYFQTPADTHWTVISVIARDNSIRQRTWEFLNEKLEVLGSKTEDTDYDSRTRPWFKLAQLNNSVIKTQPYVYSSIGEPGITFVKAIKTSGNVLGADITLQTLSLFMAEQKVTKSSKAFIFNSYGKLLTSPDSLQTNADKDSELKNKQMPTVEKVLPELANKLNSLAADGGGTSILEGSEGKLITWIKALNSESTEKEYLAIVTPLEEVLRPFNKFGRMAFITAALLILLFLPLAWYVSTRISKPIRELANETQKVKNFEFQHVNKISSRIKETAQLADSFTSMAGSIAEYRNSLMHTSKKLEMLVELGIALSSQRDENKLMEMILLAAKDLSNADGGTLYIRDEDEKEDKLRFEIIRNDSLDIALGGTTGLEIGLPPVPLRDPKSGEENHHNVVSHSVLLEKTVNISNAYTDTKFDFSGTRAFDEKSGYRSQSFLTVPLRTRGGEVIGALQLINAQDTDGNLISFSPETQDLVEALAAQAAVALENRNLVQAQVILLDSIIELIARAIDAKSPYTGGHCSRVPEISMMLTEEACKANDGPFSDFNIEDEEQWRELSISAWLHDCGKLTTPEYVVDKATKLETIYDRFNEIRTRFEVLRRDFEIDYLNQLLANDKEPESSKKDLDEKIQQLEDDFNFLAECNLGGEFMEAEKIERLKQIGNRKWLRYFSDRVGLSRDELLRKNAIPEPQLPAEESLLADRPEHIFPRTQDQELFGEGNDYGIKMDVPEHMYNQGEIYNLSVERGTLTAEERFKINEHIIQTIAMLKRLPFPKQLARVAEFAGAHHETLIGTGYPCKLKKEDMSIPARIMAIADIFEALTASDRPYKPPKTLSQSIRIMSFMRKDQHIDSDLFELFLSSGVYKRYAEKYLKPEQIDEVDLSQYITSPE